MKHDEWVKWTDQLENSLVRAETAKKDTDLLVVLRLAYQISKEQMIRTGKEEDEMKRRREYAGIGGDKNGK